MPGARRSVLLFDLDDTLLVEEPAAVAAFAATLHDLDADRLARDARARARDLWYAAPAHDYCRRIGVSSWEGLWCRFEGADPEAGRLREWAPRYRRQAWALALSDQGIDDPGLAVELGERFGTERRARHEVIEGAAEVLDGLRRDHSLVLVTNGASCLQREKLAASGLADRFEAVVVSADLGTAKPDPAVFEHALATVGATPDQAVMIGDSLRKDIDGALAVGLGVIWVNRNREPRPEGREDLVEVHSLAELPGAIALSGGSARVG